jgi:hypothetical protein
MSILDRQQVIAQLDAAARGEIDTHALSAWAFDQFYAEEAGAIAYEPGYRRAIGSVLDDLMFADQPGFHLSAGDLQQFRAHLEKAVPAASDDDDDDDDEEDGDDASTQG